MKQDTLLEYGTPQTTQTKGKLVQSCLIASNNRTIKTPFYSFVLYFFQTHSICSLPTTTKHPVVIPVDHCPYIA